jgi:hypothetical protein
MNLSRQVSGFLPESLCVFNCYSRNVNIAFPYAASQVFYREKWLKGSCVPLHEVSAGALLMRCGKLASATFLFLLTVVALASVQPGTGVGTAQLGQEQEKLCLNCHSPRFPPNDTIHDHWVYGYDQHAPGSPCYVCHSDIGLFGGSSGDSAEDPYNSANVQHPTVDEAAAMGKSDLDCHSCHYPQHIQEELQAGSIMASTPPYGPSLTAWAFMVVAGISLITGISVIGVLLSVRKRKQRTVGS